ncbi:MAG TPA: T9SS type A sorting domain-containing protein [Ferruginibacter sp.]|nr:T9SS type A sorting domain-containing protein [Ferruginibacter sp.]
MTIKILLLSTFTVISFFAKAQDQTYAITGSNTHDSLWKNIHSVDATTGKLIRDIPVIGSNDMVAAAAFDKKHNKLFFCTLKTGELKWINLGDKTVELNENVLPNQHFSTTNNIYDESDNVTRMCIGADGNGYAISNDANHLYAFTTGNTVITDLGNLTDDAANGGASVHNQCSSWGGDMIADASGKLYLITANHYVYSINITTKIATLIGTIKGLPGNFSTNGAAVTADGMVLVSSAIGKEGFYNVDFTTLSATKIVNADTSYQVSDLASSNLLFQNTTSSTDYTTESVAATTTDSKIYPNPITGMSFTVSLNEQKQSGKYTVEIADLQGITLQSSTIVVSAGSQTATVNLTAKLAQGMYIIKVLNEDGDIVVLDKVFIN